MSSIYYNHVGLVYIAQNAKSGTTKTTSSVLSDVEAAVVLIVVV